jgi:glycosyltransferase involved in cell wall biosynthesis
MQPTLSIIIPCFNSEKTLREAVESCFVQKIHNFEIILVDDRSTDSTPELIKSLAHEHPEIRFVLKEQNSGGGATRNIAVKESRSDRIFCLDSDDVLPHGMLGKLMTHMDKEVCDGVLFEATHFFENTNKNKIEVVQNKTAGDKVEFSDLFRGKVGFLAKVNFLYTKELFERAGGYPENHGFDTQTFGYKCLLNGGTITVCPNTHYLHRRDSRNASYFMREYAQGKLSYNAYLMIEECIHVLSDKTIDSILHFDIIHANRLGMTNLPLLMEQLLEDVGPEEFFIPNYKDFIKVGSFETYMSQKPEGRNKAVESAIGAVYGSKSGRFDSALSETAEAAQILPTGTLLYINMIRFNLMRSGADSRKANEMAFTAFRQSADINPLTAFSYKIRNKIKSLWKK